MTSRLGPSTAREHQTEQSATTDISRRGRGHGLPGQGRPQLDSGCDL